MTTAVQITTADELFSLPDTGQRYELVRGELRTMTPAGSEHGSIAMNVGIALGSYIQAHNLGVIYAAETGFKIASNPDTVRAPDVAFVRQEKVEALGGVPTGYWPGAPDLVVEVISPNDLYHEVDEKITDWLNAGVQVVLVVNPRQRTIRLYRTATDTTIFTDADTLTIPDLLPGWALEVKRVWPGSGKK